MNGSCPEQLSDSFMAAETVTEAISAKEADVSFDYRYISFATYGFRFIVLIFSFYPDDGCFCVCPSSVLSCSSF